MKNSDAYFVDRRNCDCVAILALIEAVAVANIFFSCTVQSAYRIAKQVNKVTTTLLLDVMDNWDLLKMKELYVQMYICFNKNDWPWLPSLTVSTNGKGEVPGLN